MNVVLLYSSFTQGEDLAKDIAASNDSGNLDSALTGMSRLENTLQNKNLSPDERINSAIIQQSPIGISVRDRNGSLILCNKSWAEIWEKPAEEVKKALAVRRSELQMDHKDDYLGENQKKVQNIYRNGGVLVLDEIYVSDVDKWVQQRFYGIQGSNDTIEFVVVLTEDVTDRKKREEIQVKLQLSTMKYKNLVENLPVAAYTTDFEGNCLSANPAMVRLFEEESQESLFSVPVSERYADSEERRWFISKLLQSGRVQDHEVELVTSLGRPFWASISATATVDEGKGIQTIDGIIQDISTKKALEKEILKNQKLESIGILAGGIAHDFNNIMAAVLGNISLARLYSGTEERVIEKLAQAEKATIRASDLTRQLLTFSRGGKPVRKTVDIRDVIKEASLFAVTGSKSLVDFDLSEDLWTAEVDESQLGQVINNLVINSVQAVPAGGEISISARNIVLNSSNRFTLPQGRYLRLVFKDQGEGIPEHIQNRIFDPYFTTKSSGSGLGLATAYSIIKNHYGSITVESSTDTGTVFFIHLPSSGRDISEALPDKPVSVMGRGRVLVMDDEKSVCHVVSEILKKHGYSVEIELDGELAVDHYRKAMKENRPFDVVITDITVPGGLGGVETAKQIHQINPDAKIIVASGYSNNEVMANFKDYGFTDSLAKPFSINVLLKSVAGAMKL